MSKHFHPAMRPLWPTAGLLLWCNAAQAHGEGALVGLGCGLGFMGGAVFGLIAGIRAAGKFPRFGQALAVFLVLGTLVAGLSPRGGEAAALFLVLGGVVGFGPFTAGYFGLRFAVQRARQWLGRARPSETA